MTICVVFNGNRWLRLQTCSAFVHDMILIDVLNTYIIWRYNNGAPIDFTNREIILLAKLFCDVFMTCLSARLRVTETVPIASHAPFFHGWNTRYLCYGMHACEITPHKINTFISRIIVTKWHQVFNRVPLWMGDWWYSIHQQLHAITQRVW